MEKAKRRHPPPHQHYRPSSRCPGPLVWAQIHRSSGGVWADEDHRLPTAMALKLTIQVPLREL